MGRGGNTGVERWRIVPSRDHGIEVRGEGGEGGGVIDGYTMPLCLVLSIKAGNRLRVGGMT